MSKPRKPQPEAAEVSQLRQRLRTAIADGDTTIDRIAKVSGLSWVTVSAFEKGETQARQRIVDAIARALGDEPRYEDVRPKSLAVRESAADPHFTTRTFASDAERISYALGVLDMAGRSNRIVMETSNEVSRAISAASAALLAPLSGPAPTAPAKTDAEYIGLHDAALQSAGAAAPATGVGTRRRAKGR
jgi:hypothetical protein